MESKNGRYHGSAYNRENSFELDGLRCESMTPTSPFAAAAAVADDAPPIGGNSASVLRGSNMRGSSAGGHGNMTSKSAIEHCSTVTAVAKADTIVKSRGWPDQTRPEERARFNMGQDSHCWRRRWRCRARSGGRRLTAGIWRPTAGLEPPRPAHAAADARCLHRTKWEPAYAAVEQEPGFGGVATRVVIM